MTRSTTGFSFDKASAFAVGVAVTFLLIAAGCSTASDPASVIEALGRAQAAEDVEATMEFFTEDAIYEYGAGVDFRGKTEIGIFFQGAHTTPVEIEYLDIEAEGNRVTWIMREERAGNVHEYPCEATVEGGKIVYMHSWPPSGVTP